MLQVKELNHHLETEKASRTDLEMYVAVLNTQKTVLTEDADKLRQQMEESRSYTKTPKLGVTGMTI